MVIEVGEAIVAGFDLVVGFFTGWDTRKSTPASKRRCSTCRRELDVGQDPLSRAYGLDCWGCVGQGELRGDLNAKVEQEIATGLRNSDRSAKR